jgi:hypothetical protein
MANTPSLKRIQIDKATSNMVIAASIAAFILIFTIISSHTLLKVLSYQNRVINAKSADVTTLNNDLTASHQLINSYQKFVSPTTNLLGSPSTGSGQNNGDNAKIVLDALPSVYDYPALTTSIQNMLTNQGVTINSITGTDQQASVTPSTSTSSAAAAPATPSTTSTNVGSAVGMPFSFSIEGPYANLQNVIKTFERSIRPFQIQTLDFSGDQSNITLTVSAQSFYQPATGFNVTTETLK